LLGIPTSGTLTNCTGLPFSTGISSKPTTLSGYGITDAASNGAVGSSGLTMNTDRLLGRTTAGGGAVEELSMGTGVATFLATPSSANLASAVTDETGSGALVFATSPVLVTPELGTPLSGVLTNCTGTASGLTAGTVTTNANLTGHITSTGNATVLGSFTSAQLATALSDETGSGAAVFGTSPTITPAAGTTSTATTGAGYMGIPQNATTTGAYTIEAADAGKHIYSTATRTITIDSNDNLALPIGTTVSFIAATGATVTIAITTDTLLLAGTGTTGSRTLGPFGMATAVKITSTSWIISGNGLT
jgi:hypothetical protein